MGLDLPTGVFTCLVAMACLKAWTGVNANYDDESTQGMCMCVPVIVGAVFAFSSIADDWVNEVLGVRADQFDRVDGEVLVQVGTALCRIWAQVALILPFLWGNTQSCTCEHKYKHTHTHSLHVCWLLMITGLVTIITYTKSLWKFILHPRLPHGYNSLNSVVIKGFI